MTLSEEAKDKADLEFSKFQLQHVLAARQYKHSWKQLSVGLHLREYMSSNERYALQTVQKFSTKDRSYGKWS